MWTNPVHDADTTTAVIVHLPLHRVPTPVLVNVRHDGHLPLL